MAGVRNFKNLLLINQKIYVHGWVFVCYQYLGILYCTVTPSGLPVFSLRDASCDVIDIEIMCRTFGSVIVVLFPICSFARGKGSLETMIYLTVFDYRHGFRSTLKLSQFLARLNGPYFGLCQTYGYFNRTPRSPCAPFDGKRRSLRIDLVGAKSAFLFGYRKGQIERRCQSSF